MKKIKENIRFYIIVSAILALSLLILSGCMYAVSESKDDEKDYKRDERPIEEDKDKDEGVQTELQKKFGAMSKISSGENSITVITEDFLDKYWKAQSGESGTRNEIRSLSAEEILYIVKDSFYIYTQYDKIILPSLEPYSEYVAIRSKNTVSVLPDAKERRITGLPKLSPDKFNEINGSVYDIIIYRLAALSSPEAFFTGANALVQYGYDLKSRGVDFLATMFYVSDCTQSKREEWMKYAISAHEANGSAINCYELFGLGYIGKNEILCYTYYPTSSYAKIYPIDEIEITLNNIIEARLEKEKTHLKEISDILDILKEEYERLLAKEEKDEVKINNLKNEIEELEEYRENIKNKVSDWIDISAFDKPMSQKELQEKYADLGEVFTTGKGKAGINALSKDFLVDYWGEGYLSGLKDGRVRSLTDEEIYYIIQDSIRIYTEYDEIYLPDSAIKGTKLPNDFKKYFRSQHIDPDLSDYEKASEDIFRIILTRLAALSSDDAFFTGAEALEYCHKTYDSLGQSFPQTVFYIPGYSNKTDRNSILTLICSDNNLPDCAECHVFVIGYGNHCIYSHQKDGKRTFIYYPTSQVRTIVNEYIAQEEKYTKELEDFFKNKNKEAE